MARMGTKDALTDLAGTITPSSDAPSAPAGSGNTPASDTPSTPPPTSSPSLSDDQAVGPSGDVIDLGIS